MRKPDGEIFRHVLNEQHLNASEEKQEIRRPADQTYEPPDCDRNGRLSNISTEWSR